MGFFKKIKEKIISKTTKKNKDDVLDVLKQSNQKKVKKYEKAMKKSRESLSIKIEKLASKYRKIDETYFEELEEILIMADIGAHLVMKLLEELKKTTKLENIQNPKLINELLFDKFFALYVGNGIVDTTLNLENEGLNIALVIGVNGSGKTTSIAKLANQYIKMGKKVMVAAGDTFRAGAVEQLQIWSKRVNATIVVPKKMGQDPASVVFEAITKAKAENYDLLICDTAGRLQNKKNLMEELNKIHKIIKRVIPEAPHENLLVIDATTGQNGVSQAQSFHETTKLTGIILTKMDGTSKGGIILAIKEYLDIPVKLIGLGEKLDDLQEFDLDQYIYGLTKNFVDAIK